MSVGGAIDRDYGSDYRRTQNKLFRVPTSWGNYQFHKASFTRTVKGGIKGRIIWNQ